MLPSVSFSSLGLVIASIFSANLSAHDETGRLEFNVVDAQGEPVACRIHLFDGQGKPVRVTGYEYWHDHFICDGKAELNLPSGTYNWAVEKGPEFARKSGEVKLKASETATVKVKMPRIANLQKKNWFCGDMHIHRNPAHIKLLMQAEELNFAPVITWWNRPLTGTPTPTETVFRFDQNRIYTTMGGEDERTGGALLFFGLDRPLDLTVKSKEYPSPMRFVKEAREVEPQVWIDIEKPFWWDVPTWLASGKMNSVGIANNHMCRSQMLANEAWGKPRDQKRLPNPNGNGYWTQEIYYHLLNSGLRLPPSAGSASGVLPNPVGYNRIYVFCDKQFNRDNWFDSLKSGRVFVTNGPLLVATANQSLSGTSLDLDAAKHKIQFDVELTTEDKVSNLDVIHNGKIIKKIPCDTKTEQKLSVAIDVKEPGWILIRAIADNQNTFRFASTAPWYLTGTDGKTGISRKSSRFFLDWTNERIARIKKNVPDPDQRNEVLRHHLKGLDFWTKRLEQATRD